MARQPDMFPNAPRSPIFDNGQVDIELHLHNETGMAWLLSKTGMERDAVWLPKSIAERSERFPRIFTLPRQRAISEGLL